MWLLLLWGLIMVAAIYLYYQQIYRRFSKLGIKGPRPVPFLGTMSSILFRREHFVDAIDRNYRDYPNEKFIGTYEFYKPVVSLRDLELVKKITVKDFDHFVDHSALVDEETDPFFGKNLFSMKGQKWRDMRSTLSPAFTSSKMRAMVPFMVEVGDQMIHALKKKMKESESEYTDIEIKDLATRYANDVVASCAFGLKVDSLKEENNEFYKMGKAASNLGFWAILKIFGFSAFPALMKTLKVSLFSDEVKIFFKTLVLETMKEREAKNIIRPDMIHLLMEAKKGKLSYDASEVKDPDAGFATVEESSVGKRQVTRTWDDVEIVAQALLFFMAGFETVASVMAFLLIELALNPDMQEKLYQEIKETSAKNGGKFDYNSILSMTYMDMVVSEVLRLWPAALATDRLCVKDYNLGKANDKAEDFIIRKGESVEIPVWAFHRDPEYFPNPNKFDPERFAPENVHNIKPFTFQPFGLGPRNCIGSRFALCEVKLMVCQLLEIVEVSPGEKLKLPIKLDMNSFNLIAKGGHWLRIKSRQ